MLAIGPLCVVLVVLMGLLCAIIYLVMLNLLVKERRANLAMKHHSRPAEESPLVPREHPILSAMISAMDEGVVLTDSHNVISEVNQHFCNLATTTREQLVGHSLDLLRTFLPAKVAEMITRHAGAYQENTNVDPLVVQHPFGEMEMIFKLQPVFPGGKFSGTVLNIVDVTELVQARKQAEEANHAKTMFLANMSHELRTPLTVINGFAEVMLEDPDSLTENQTKFLGQISSSGQHLLHIINDMIDLARIETGRLNLEQLPMDLTQVCKESLAMIASSMQNPEIQIRTDIPSQAVVVTGDSLRLKQVMINLLSNAVKYTLDGWVLLWLKDLSETVEIGIKDTGIGIALEDQARLFRPFEQVHDKLKTAAEGTGLGLALSQEIVQAHGGAIRIESTLGEGSHFIVSLPRDISGSKQE